MIPEKFAPTKHTNSGAVAELQRVLDEKDRIQREKEAEALARRNAEAEAKATRNKIKVQTLRYLITPVIGRDRYL